MNLFRVRGIQLAVHYSFFLLLAMVLTARSMKGSRLAAVSPALIASGRFEQAEEHIAEALKSFSLFRNVKLRSLHHLAMLRHAQRRFGETAMLCQALLSERLGPLNTLSRSARLIPRKLAAPATRGAVVAAEQRAQAAEKAARNRRVTSAASIAARAAAKRAYPYKLQAHYYSIGPMGAGMGKVEIEAWAWVGPSA